MKLLIALLFSASVFGQNLIIDCQTKPVIERGEIKIYDTIQFTCNNILPMFDNSVLYVYRIEGFGKIMRFDAGGGSFIEELGIDRRTGDANPMLILIGNEEDFINLIIGEHIDYAYYQQN